MMKSSIRSLASGLRWLSLAFMLAMASVAAQAAVIIVYSTNGTYADTVSNTSGSCSLREAIVNSNMAFVTGAPSNAGSIGCTAGTGVDTIVLPPQGVVINSSLIDDPTDVMGITGDLDIKANITIVGGGSWSTISTVSGGRIFDVQPGGQLTLDGVQLLQGSANDEGGAVRVQANGSLSMRYSSISLSTTPATVAGGLGGGLYVATGGTANINQSEISYNQVQGVISEGGGVYCDAGCQLNISDSSIIYNTATDSGGGIYVAPGGTLDMRQTAVGNNTAVNGSGVYSLGSVVNFFGNVLADNGVGAAGDDLDCTAGIFSPMVPVDASLNPIPGPLSFIEFPAANCNVGSAVVTRSSLAATPAGYPDAVFYSVVNLGFMGAPTRAYHIAEQFFSYTRHVIPVDARVPLTGQLLCQGHIDQIGHAMPSATNCDLGAVQLSGVYVPIYSADVAVNGTPAAAYMNLDTPPVNPVTISLTPIGGVGEPCNPNFHIDFSFAAGQTFQTAYYDPAQVFSTLALNRPVRVCKLAGTASGDIYTGGMPGVYWIRVTNTAVTTSGLASPMVGSYIDFGIIPVSTPPTVSGQPNPATLQTLVIQPTVNSWVINSISIPASQYSSQFSIVAPSTLPTPTSPAAVPTLANGGYPIQVQCLPGTIGTFDAELDVDTNFGPLVWGLRCTQAHTVSLQVSPVASSSIPENSATPGYIRVNLDSPNQLSSALQFSFQEIPYATAISGADFNWLSPLVVTPAPVPDPASTTNGTILVDSFTLSIPPGQQSATAYFQPVDDGVYTGSKSFSVQMLGINHLTPPYQYVYMLQGSSQQADITIAEADPLVEGINVALLGMPASAAAGSRVNAVVKAVNTGTTDILSGAISIQVDPPAKILSFVLPGNPMSCPVSTDGRSASCELTSALITPQTASAGGSAVQVQAVLLMAEMNQAPQLDYKGHITVTASGVTSDKTAVSGTQTVDYVIQGTGIKTGPAGGVMLFLLGLLGFRWHRVRQGCCGS